MVRTLTVSPLALSPSLQLHPGSVRDLVQMLEGDASLFMATGEKSNAFFPAKLIPLYAPPPPLLPSSTTAASGFLQRIAYH